MLFYGTHNSGTSGKLVWWQWIFTPIFQLFSKCQDKSIKEQLKMGVKLFNLQVTWYNGDWHFSHGLCIYEEKLMDALKLMSDCATPEIPIYYQLYLDKNFFLSQKKEKFRELCNELSPVGNKVILLNSWIEGTDEYPYKSGIKLNSAEHYWTMSWAKNSAKTWVDRLPLPKRHAELYNTEYKKKYKDMDIYLMLDFFELGSWR